MLKIGLVGVGHLGKIHLKLLKESKKYELVGFFDSDVERSLQIEKEFNCLYFNSLDKLLDEIQVIDIACETSSHYKTALESIAKGKHLFIEKPIASNSSEAREIIKLCQEKNLKGQVGHVERFNPAFLAAKEAIKDPKFIEIHRLAPYNPRGTDVSVILDLMIHDIDIVLSKVNSPIKEVKSNGVSVISETPDIVNARVEFENGSIANFTTSRISLKPMRKMRFFQENAYISVDFLDKKTEIVKIDDKDLENGIVIEDQKGNKKSIQIDPVEINPNNAILDELESFADSIENNSPIAVTLEQATKALELAEQIERNLNK